MADVKKIIKDLGDLNWAENDKNQMVMVQLIKGLSLSSDPLSNKFIKMLSDASTKIASTVLGGDAKDDKAEDKNESALVSKTNLILEGIDELAKPELKNTIQTKTINRASELL